jgi:hypothetical protein
MIFLDSRYNDAILSKVSDSRTDTYQLTAFRQFPSYKVKFFHYDWVETDRWDLISLRYLGNPSFWWQILDINPEILDPLEIKPGTQIRIPSE